jgi:hypothetical protein
MFVKLQLEAMLGEDRLLYVPVSTHTGAVPPSMLVNHVMRELNIIIRPEDIYSRCMDCNKRGFVRFPMPVVRVLFYMNVGIHSLIWAHFCICFDFRLSVWARNGSTSPKRFHYYPL